MKTIDFLPDIYRQREALRRAALVGHGGRYLQWRIAASALAQAWLRHSLHQQLDDLRRNMPSPGAGAGTFGPASTKPPRGARSESLYVP